MGLSMVSLFDFSDKNSFEHIIYETQEHNKEDEITTHLKSYVSKFKHVSHLSGMYF